MMNDKQEEIEKEADEIAADLGLDYVLTSAKENIGVNEAFTKLIEAVYDRLYGDSMNDVSQIIEASNQNTGWFRNLFGQNSNDNDQQNQNVNLNNRVNTNNNANSGCC